MICLFFKFHPFSMWRFSVRLLNEEVRRFLALPAELRRLAPRGGPTGAVADWCEQIHVLKLRRIELLSLPANSVSNRNRELVSLGVGAVSGALSLSIHPAFALVFFLSYRMYKSANRPTVERLRSPETVREINEEVRRVEVQVEQELARLRAAIEE